MARTVAFPTLPLLLLGLASALLGLSATARADLTLTDIHAGLKGVWHAGIAWGDYDNDGRLDIVLSGDSSFAGTGYVTRIYHNDGASFRDIRAGTLLNLGFSAVAWGDYDGDSDLDLFLTGSPSASRLYRNDDGFFRQIGGFFESVSSGAQAWFDYDNDGDLDLVLTGNGTVTRLYRNDGNSTFVRVSDGSGLPTGDGYTSVSAFDLDNDGNTDLLFDGVLMRNLGGGKWILYAVFPSPFLAASAVGDFDSDGDFDLFVFGPGTSAIYRNDGPAGFVDIHAGTDTLQYGSAKWIDFDNDGYLDLFQTGLTSVNGPGRTHLYRNDHSGNFIPIPGNTAFGGSSSDWGDFDNDGDADLLITGFGAAPKLSGVFRSDGVPPNAPPDPPTGLTSSLEGNRLILRWDPATDDRTPSLGLSYNVRVGTQPGRDNLVPCMADPVTGQRRVTRLGNASQRTWMAIQLPAMWDVLYWSVQAIDGSYAGSPFAPEQMIGGSVPALPANVSAEAGSEGVRLMWYRAGGVSETNTVYRRETESSWAPLGFALPGDSPQFLSFTDSNVRPGGRYAYRLGLMDGQSEVFSEEVWVDVPRGALSFALEPVTPNPAPSGNVRARFSLPTASPASLSLVDARGRILATDSFSGAGRFSAVLRPLQRLANGRYFLRLEQGHARIVRPLTVLD